MGEAGFDTVDTKANAQYVVLSVTETLTRLNHFLLEQNQSNDILSDRLGVTGFINYLVLLQSR